MKSPRLINGEALKNLKKLDDQTIDLIITDPPYNLGLFMKNRKTNLSAMRKNHFSGKNWDMLGEEVWLENIDLIFKEFSRVLKKKGAIILFIAIIKLERIIKLAEKNNFYYKTTGIWHKKNPMPRNLNLHFINSTESWLYFINNGKTGTFNNNGKAIHDFFESSNTSTLEKENGKHPTQKPTKLITFLLEILSNPSDIVLDPFMGSGSTGVSCIKSKRSFIGIELEKNYFEIAKKRINKESCQPRL